MSYLKLRTIASKMGGRFYLEDAVKVLGLSERTTKAHLKALKEVEKGNGFYWLKSSLKLELLGRNKSSFVLISEEKLKTYSWKNISEFHALLTEIELSRYKRHQESKVKGYKVFNHKDKIFEKIQDGKNSGFHNLMSIECASLVVKKSLSTISRYKKKQDVSKYFWKKITKFEDKYTKGGSFNFALFLKEHKGKFISTHDTFIFSPIASRVSGLTIKVG